MKPLLTIITMMTQSKIIGKVVRVEWNEATDEVRVVLEITDEEFKSKILHSKDLEDLISLEGKDVMKVASRATKR